MISSTAGLLARSRAAYSSMQRRTCSASTDLISTERKDCLRVCYCFVGVFLRIKIHRCAAFKTVWVACRDVMPIEHSRTIDQFSIVLCLFRQRAQQRDQTVTRRILEPTF